jgi:hypothetical protein
MRVHWSDELRSLEIRLSSGSGLMPGNVLGQHVSRAAMDYQVNERQNYGGSEADGGRIDSQSKNSARKQEHTQYGNIYAFVNFQDEIAKNEANRSNYETPVHPNAHSPALPRAD